MSTGKQIKYPSSGLIGIQYVHKTYPDAKIHIYGMNWNFEKEGWWTNHNNEENIIKNCCPNCIIHPTKNNNYR